MQASYQNVSDILMDAAQVLLPPERITVSQAAEKYRYLYNPGSYIGEWRNDSAPYLVEVMDILASRHYKSAIYVKPAQSGGTEVTLNWMLYGMICDPADMYMYQTKESTARDFSKDKLAKMIRHCPDAKAQLVPGRAGDTTHTKLFRSGTRLKLSWPSINEMSGHSTGRIALTDYDRMEQDVDGEGSPFWLAQKRTTTFGSFAMTFVESSPGFPILQSDWRVPKENPHFSPPCDGILSLYNAGDRRRWYWPCVHCGAYFEPSFEHMWWPEDEQDIHQAASKAEMTCPACGANLPSDAKHELNLAGVWIRETDFVELSDGNRWIPKSAPRKKRKAWKVALDKPTAYGDMASFWGKGPIAAFLSWQELVLKYLRAKQEYDVTGDYQALKTTVNTDQCEPFKPPHDAYDRLAEDLMDRVEELGERVVPENVRLLLACVDVQKRRFVVQVHGVGPGGDITVIDRFDIVKSERRDEDGDRFPVEPATYAEDWELIERLVLDASYPLDDDSKRQMKIKAVACDSGGAASTIGRRAGVTEKAYKFYRKLKRKGKHQRFHLIKGASNKNSQRLVTTFPDAERRDRHAGARGDIPVLLINPNILKDSLDGMLNRTEPGGGMIHFPTWLEIDFFKELCAEIWSAAKGWTNPRGRRNESWDLLVYCLALNIKLKLETMDWDKPYRWAQPWDDNILVFGDEPSESRGKDSRSLTDMGGDLL